MDHFYQDRIVSQYFITQNNFCIDLQWLFPRLRQENKTHVRKPPPHSATQPTPSLIHMCIHILNVCFKTTFMYAHMHLKTMLFLWSLLLLIAAAEGSVLNEGWGEKVMASIHRIIKGITFSNVIQACLFCGNTESRFLPLMPACPYVLATKDSGWR